MAKTEVVKRGRGRPRKTEEEKAEYRRMKAAMTPEQRIALNAEHITKHNLPVLTNGLELSNPDVANDNRVYLNNALQLFNLPTIDFSDEEQVIQRVVEYFDISNRQGSKLSITGLALALGIDRTQLTGLVLRKPVYDYKRRQIRLSDEGYAVLKKAYRIIEKSWQDMVDNGKVNPAIGIFIAKNHFGYRDQVENIITPNVEPERNFDSESISGRYLTEDTED